MKCFSWKVRGLGNLRNVRRLRNTLRHVRPRLVFLIETNVSLKQMEWIRCQFGFLHGIDVGSIGSRGGLSLGWRAQDRVILRSFSQHHIDVDIWDDEDEFV